jgi:hypothetical protein
MYIYIVDIYIHDYYTYPFCWGVQRNNREHRLEHSSLRRDSRFDLGEIWHQMSCYGRPMMSSGIERSRFAQKPGTRQIAHGSHGETGNICFINVKKHPVQVDLHVDDCAGRRQWSNTHLKLDWDWPVVSSPTAHLSWQPGQSLNHWFSHQVTPIF